MKARTGFTLIEVAVVIMTIGVIATLFFPTIAQTPAAVQANAEESNISKLAKGILQYAQDNDGKFPRAGYDCRSHNSDPELFAEGEKNQCGGDGWQDAIGPYVKDPKVFVAANDKSALAVAHWDDKLANPRVGGDGGTASDFRTTDGNLSYLYNDFLSLKMPTKNATATDEGYADPGSMDAHTNGLRVTDVKTPSDCLMLTEGHGGWDKSKVDPKAMVVTDWTGSSDIHNKWHHESGVTNNTFFMTTKSYSGVGFIEGIPFANSGGNVAFVDGHEAFKIFTSPSGLPALCRSLPWPKTMDPQQRGASKDSCADSDNPVGAGWHSSNWY